VGCGRLLNPEWDVCPYCGLFLEQEEDEGEEGAVVEEEPEEEVADEEGDIEELRPEPAPVAETVTLSEADVAVDKGIEEQQDPVSDQAVQGDGELDQEGEGTSEYEEGLKLPRLI
jgi:hypothetical protein